VNREISPSVAGTPSHSANVSQNQSTSLPDGKRRSSTLDVVRGLAIVAVVAVHSWEQSWAILDSPVNESSLLFQFISLLRYGVELFFVLSGWLIFSLYYRKSNIRARAYWVRRLLRIWPLWIVFSIAAVALLANTDFKFPMGIEPVGQQPSLLVGTILIVLFLGWLTPFTWETTPGGWSIQVEMGHYLLFWPLRKLAPIAIAATIMVGYVSYFVANALAIRSPEEFGTEFARSWIRLGLYGTWPFFVMGGLIYLWSLDKFSWRTQYFGSSNRSRSVFFLIMGLIFITAIFIPIPFGKTYEAAFSVLFLYVVALAARRTKNLTRIMSSLGKYSYFIYFAHFWVLAVVIKVAESNQSVSVSTVGLLVASTVLFAACLVVSWSLAVFSWRFFESPILKLARKVPTKSLHST